MKKLLNILANTVLAFFMLLFLAVIMVPHFTGLTIEPILSGSMEPQIKTGALVVISKTNPETIREGDIISFWVKGTDLPVCHRVIKIVKVETGYGFITKGDANEEADSWVVGPHDVIGELTHNLTGVGYMTQFIKTSGGFMWLLVAPAGVIAFLEARKIFFASQAKRKRPTLLRPNKNKFNFFVPILDGLLAVSVLWGIMAVNISDRSLGSLALITPDGQNTKYIAKRTIHNNGRVPMVICLASSDPSVEISEKCVRIYPGQEKLIEVSGSSEVSRIKMGGYFPILPQAALYRLFTWNALFAPLLVSAIWIVPLTAIAFFGLRLLVGRTEPIQRVKILKGIRSYE